MIGLQNGVQQLERVMAWNWYENKVLWLKVDYWEGTWGPRQGQWREYNEGRVDDVKKAMVFGPSRRPGVRGCGPTPE